MSSRLLTRFKNIPLEARVSLAYAICGVLQNCLAFITLPLFTRLLTKEQYGQFTIYTSWSAILVIFITLNLPYGSFSTAMVKFESERDRYIASAEGICLLFSAAFLALYLPFHTFWNRFLKLPTFLMLLMVFELLGKTGILFWSGKKRFEFKYKSVIVVTLLNSFLAPLLAYLLIIHTEEKGYARIFGYAIVSIVLGGFIFIQNIIRGRKIYTAEFWKYALGFNLPLICYYLSQVVFNQSDRIMIDHYCGKADAAIYGVAHTLSMTLTFVLTAINNSYVPWFYGKIKENKERDNQSISCIIAVLMAVLLLAVIWLAPEFILIMAGKDYTSAVAVVPPVAMSVLLLFYSQLFINVEFYHEKKGHLVVASIASALINIGLNALFIPRFGFAAAGYTTFVSYLVFVAGNYLAMKHILKEKDLKNDAYNFKALLLIFLLFAGFAALALVLYGRPMIRYGIIAVALLAMAIKHKLIMKYITMLKNL